MITTVVGSANAAFGGDSGVASAAQLYHPLGVAVDAGGSVYVEDTSNKRIRKAAVQVQVTAPTNLTVARSGARALLSWTGSMGATSYNVYRGTTSGGETLLATGIVGTTYVDAGVVANTTYYYVVTAVSFGTQSPGSNEVSFRLSNANSSSDFDGDGKADVAIYRPFNGGWYILKSSTNSKGLAGIVSSPRQHQGQSGGRRRKRPSLPTAAKTSAHHP